MAERPTISAIEPPERDERSGALVRDAAELAQDTSADSCLIGYTILAFYSDGATRTAGYRPSPTEHKMGSTMFEAWGRATLESHFAYGEGVQAAHDVLDGRN